MKISIGCFSTIEVMILSNSVVFVRSTFSIVILCDLLDDLDDIPKGPTKKILYRELKKYYIEKHPIT